MNCPSSELVSQLATYGVNVDVNGGRVRLRMPWPPDRAPGEVKHLLRKLKAQAAPPEVRPETSTVAGNVVRLHKMRPTCQDAGHCLGLTRETDCNLFPVRPGWCRERI